MVTTKIKRCILISRVSSVKMLREKESPITFKAILGKKIEQNISHREFMQLGGNGVLRQSYCIIYDDDSYEFIIGFERRLKHLLFSLPM